jgi:hypothetical protein
LLQRGLDRLTADGSGQRESATRRYYEEKRGHHGERDLGGGPAAGRLLHRGRYDRP